jgi:photosystem II stability/assembly factor-like uncharacterized protein
MKKFLLLLCFTAAVIYPQTMREVVKGTYSSLSSVYFIDENTGWMAGSYERIYKTTDGGNIWNMLHESSTVSTSLACLHFLDANTGFAGGGETKIGKVLKTTDGGSTWTELTSPDTMAVKRIYFSDVNTGWVLTSLSNAGHVVKTTDGGATWNVVMNNPTGDMEGMYMLPSGRGIAVGGGVGKIDIHYTADGTTWTKAPAPSLHPGYTYTRTDVRSVYMVNDNLAYTCGWGFPGQPNILLKSTDGGASWTFLPQAVENMVTVNLNSIIFKDELNGLAVGGGAYEGTVVVRTSDGGTNWIPIPNGFGFTAQEIVNVGNKAWVVGASGCIGYTDNWGDNWTLKTPIIGTTINDMTIVDNSIIVAGHSGLILKSTDKGVNWTSSFAAIDRVCNSINGIHFIDENIGFAARNNRLVSKTTDGAATWTKIIPDTNVTGLVNTGVYFFDESNGYVAGRVASNVDVIYKTTDGGINWNLTTNTAMENLNYISFADTDKGAAVGQDSKILYTANAGSSWQTAAFAGLPSGLEVDILRLEFMNADKGVAVGQNCIFTTDDGGATWTYIVVPGLNKVVNDVAFKDENEGWAAGDDGLILHSTDGGKTWTDVSDTLTTGTKDIQAIAVDDNGFIWIGAGESTVYTNAPFVAMEDNVPVPGDFYLAQNFPNPFNPSTTIKFSIAGESKVSLRVYDILGNLISELFNGFKPAGEYQISFDAGNISSGVYFLVMNTEGKVLSRKMTLIK